MVGVGACHAICACMRCRSKFDRCDSGDRVRRCSGRCVSRHKHASCLVERWARGAELPGGAVGAWSRAGRGTRHGPTRRWRSRAAWWSGGRVEKSCLVVWWAREAELAGEGGPVGGCGATRWHANRADRFGRLGNWHAWRTRSAIGRLQRCARDRRRRARMRRRGRT